MASSLNDICILDCATKSVLAAKEDISGRVRSIACDLVGNVLVGCDEGTIFSWQLDGAMDQWSNGQLDHPRVLHASSQCITDIDIVPTSSLDPNQNVCFVTSSEDGRVQLWELPPENPAVVPVSSFNANDLCVVGDNLYLPGSDGTLMRWNAGDKQASVVCHLATPFWGSSLASPEDGRLYAGTKDGIVEIDLLAQREVRRLSVADKDQRCVGLVIVGSELWACFTDHVLTYALETGEIVSTHQLATGSAIQLLRIPGRNAALIVTYDALYELEADRLSLIETAPTAASKFAVAHYSQAGQSLVIAHADQSITVRKSIATTIDFKLQGHRLGFEDFHFFDNDRLLASVAHDETLRFWDLRSRRQLGCMDVTRAGHEIIHFPEQAIIAAADANGFITVFRYGK